MIKKIYLAGGCFWGIEAYFSKLKGIIETKTGYANGLKSNTSYENLKETKHAETVLVKYDDNFIYLAEILERFYKLIDPFSINKQGEDEGEQYRTGIFLEDIDGDEFILAKEYDKFITKKYHQKTAVKIEKLNHFILAEDYHQKYLEKNPKGYCHINLTNLNNPLYNFNKLTKKEINRLKLSDLEKDIMIYKKTETPFTSIYNNFNETGLYVDKISKEPLFISDDKFDAGCGWPSFSRTVITNSASYYEDFSHNMIRTEVCSKVQNSHLGHVFDDGPKEKTSLRFCINGNSLSFIKYENLNNTVYEGFKFYFKKFIEDIKKTN